MEVLPEASRQDTGDVFAEFSAEDLVVCFCWEDHWIEKGSRVPAIATCSVRAISDEGKSVSFTIARSDQTWTLRKERIPDRI